MQPATTLVKPARWLESNEEILLLARPQLLGLGYGGQGNKKIIIIKKQPHFILVLGSCQPFPVPWVEGKAETFPFVRKMESFAFPTFPFLSQGQLNVGACQSTTSTGTTSTTTSRRTGFPRKVPAARCCAEGRRDPRTPAPALPPAPLLPYARPYPPRHGGHIFPPSILFRAWFAQPLPREREGERNMRKRFPQRNKADRSRFPLQTPHLGV